MAEAVGILFEMFQFQRWFLSDFIGIISVRHCSLACQSLVESTHIAQAKRPAVSTRQDRGSR